MQLGLRRKPCTDPHRDWISDALRCLGQGLQVPGADGSVHCLQALGRGRLALIHQELNEERQPLRRPLVLLACQRNVGGLAARQWIAASASEPPVQTTPHTPATWTKHTSVESRPYNRQGLSRAW